MIKSIFTLAILLSSGVALADSTPSLKDDTTSFNSAVARFQDACASDIKEHCGDVTPGQARIAACLMSKEDKLTPACNSARTDLGEKISNRIDTVEVSFRKSCNSDINKYCSNVPSGRGRILECLDQHEGSLTTTCTNFQKKIAAKLDEYVKSNQ